MKLRVGIIAGLAVSTFTSVGSAASLNDIVIKGPMAERINEKNELSVSRGRKDRQTLRGRSRVQEL